MRSLPASLPSYLSPAIDMHTHPPPDRGKMGAMLDAARAVGITRVIMSSLGYTDMVPYPSPEDVRRGNEEVLSLVDRYRGLVYGYVYVNPNHADALKVVEEGLARPGIVGIKLWISCRDEAGRLDPVYPVLELAEARRRPVLIHTFYRTPCNNHGELSPTDIAHLARRYPGAPIVMAHLGGKWHRGLRVARPYPNVYTDLSGMRAYLGSVEYAVAELGAGRVLFGSDAHIRAFAGQLAKVVGAELEVADKRRILWDNSARLYWSESA